MVAISAEQNYSRENVCRMLDVQDRQLRSWEKQGLIEGGEEFTFSDIIALRTLIELRKKRIPAKTIGRALASLKDKLSHVERPLSELRISSDGRRIAVNVSGQRMEAISGQLLFDFEAGDLPSLRSFPVKPKLNQEREAENWFQRGLMLEETGAPVEEAVEAYNKAIELNPSAAGALVNLGTIYFRMGKLERAEKFYRLAVEADPRYPLAQFNLGNLFDEQGESDQAMKHYLEAVKLNPQYSDAYFNMALLCEQTGGAMRAVGYWKTYLKLDSSSSWAQIARRQLDRLKQVTLVGSK